MKTNVDNEYLDLRLEPNLFVHIPSYKRPFINILIINIRHLFLSFSHAACSTESSIGTPSYKTHMKMTIFSVTQADYTTYKCVAKNPRGETDGSIRLYGKYPCLHVISVKIQFGIQSKRMHSVDGVLNTPTIHVVFNENIIEKIAEIQ